MVLSTPDVLQGIHSPSVEHVLIYCLCEPNLSYSCNFTLKHLTGEIRVDISKHSTASAMRSVSLAFTSIVKNVSAEQNSRHFLHLLTADQF